MNKLLEMFEYGSSIKIKDLKVDGYQSNLYVMLKQLLFFDRFYDLFCRWHSLMSRPCYYSTHSKHLESPIPGNKSFFEMLQLFDIWRYQSLMISFFNSVVILI